MMGYHADSKTRSLTVIIIPCIFPKVLLAAIVAVCPAHSFLDESFLFNQNCCVNLIFLVEAHFGDLIFPHHFSFLDEEDEKFKGTWTKVVIYKELISDALPC